MAEKLISEIKVIEMEDGYRIEIRGDKERIRKFGFPLDECTRQGRRSRFWRRWAWGASPWDPWWSETPGSESAPGAGPQDQTS
jgi:hypothetical protein